MAIFSRRTLQRLINENASFLTKKQTRKHVDELNNGKLDFEWEVVLLNVFSKLGKVVHEPVLENSRKEIDILFSSEDNSKIAFLADIKTVKDEGIEISNPQKQFARRLSKELLKHSLNGEWNYRIGDDYKQEGFYSRCKLKLPALSRFDTEIFNQDFEKFLCAVKNAPTQNNSYKIKTNLVDLEITYFPSEKSILSGNFVNYKQPNDWTYSSQNTIYSKLEEKGDQLKKSGYEGTLGIIICDGGTEFLRKSRHVIVEFLKNNLHINFVLAFDIEQNFGFRNYSQVKIYFEKGQELSEELEEFLFNLHKHTSKIFPYPIKNAINAVISSNNYQTNKINSFYKGATMEIDGAKIKLSSRKILELLAGKLSYDKFPKEYKDYFKDMLDKGKLITEVEIETESDEDDDLLIFKFGEPDVAVSPFKVPDSYK